jgi:competence protein ComFB
MIEMANVAESSLRVKNVNEERVLNAVGGYVDSGLAHCSCTECALDLLAIALNQTPPRYVANEVLMDVYGERHGALTDTDIKQTVMNAAIRVASNPRCGVQTND